MSLYSLKIGEYKISYCLLSPDTLNFFDDYLTESSDSRENYDVCVSREYMKENMWLVNEDEQSQPFIEFQCLMLATGNYLLDYKRALFHGAAIFWKGKAWIFTAPSGTGKTTQVRHWKKLVKSTAKIINGDKPFLEWRDDGSVWVYSSPWRGKEKYGRPGLSAPLGGIILLEQGNENQIMKMAPEAAVIPLFIEFVSYPENTEQIKHQADILDHVLSNVPVWKLVNLGDEASAELTIKTLEEYLETGI